MNLRWLWLDHIPAELALAPAERAEVQRLAKQKRLKEPRFRKADRISWVLALTTALPLVAVFVAWIVLLVFLRLANLWLNVSVISGILIFNLLLWVCVTWALHRTNRPYVRRALCQSGKPVCMECGYILTGVDDATRPCPECGAEREPVHLPSSSVESSTNRQS